MELSATNLAKLKRVHPDLKRVILRAAAITTVPFMIIQGDRTLAQQKINVARGFSKTMNSRHLIRKDGMVYAVDIAPTLNGKVSWAWPGFYKLAPIIKRAAALEKVTVEWGGDWKSFKDGPHWQLPWKKYPG